MEPGAEHRVGELTKSEILRGIITEKLCTAAREILAVVERTVSGYEEEAAGFRLEVEQQRSQLEALLQVSSIKLEETDDQQLYPSYQPPPPPPPEEEELGRGEPVEEEQQHKYELSVEADGGVSLLCFTGEYHVEEESTEQALPTPTKDQEPITEQDFDTLTGSFTPSAQSYRRSTGRQRISEEQNHVDLRIRILGDSQINCLSSEVYRKYPLHELQCPRGLRETDFLHLLRSTFPQLADDFDFFTTDRSRKLHPLKVKKLTPEEIHRSIRSNGTSALYIRLKEQRIVSVFQKHKEPRVSTEEFHPSPGGAAASTSCHSGVQSDRRRPRIKETLNSVTLKLRILENPDTKTLSNDVYRMSPLQQLQCPLGLKESGFLRLLRSTFPQLAGDKPFDVFTYDNQRKLHPLRMNVLTPETINRRILSCGRAYLCIRLRHLDELQSREEHLPTPADPTNLNTGIQSDRKKVGRPRRRSSHNHLDFKICILEDRRLSRFSLNVNQKFPLQRLQCPRGLKKTDFLHLLRSTFPQLAGDKPFDFLKSDRRKNLLPLRVKTLTPDEIHRRICLDGRSTLYIRPKAPEEAQSNKETSRVLRKPKQDTRPTRLRSTSQGREDEKIETKENDKKSLDLWPLLVPESEREEDESKKEDNDWKLEKSEKNRRKRESEKTQSLRFNRAGTKMKRRRIQPSPRASSPRASSSRASSPRASSPRASSPRASSPRASSPRAASPPASSPRASPSRASSSRQVSTRASSPWAVTALGEVIPSCKVCGAVRRSVNMVIKHSWNHVDDPARLCGVCGKCSASAEELRHHLHGHQKTHACPICGKCFLSIHGLKGHIARHNGEKPYACKICHKAFPENWVLNSHMMVHRDNTSHTCDVCQKPFSSTMKLKLHRAAHSEPAARTRSHVCEICSKKFHTSWKLKAHARGHGGKFLSESKLMTRVKIQTL
ncbi:uncharacterized protein LOC133949602 isoform X2 [Platichthys flesus]|uniref:uncharacterized protein LOC133949602 isoform X2 n=1 Tax=Platichthys flesus TaxID=8260 RepID=UPI002DB69D83|nr:uncharacterized protein LOC133949602 isoform X2 [Platichthys flesus]